jgi:hypothetical protein
MREKRAMGLQGMETVKGEEFPKENLVKDNGGFI